MKTELRLTTLVEAALKPNLVSNYPSQTIWTVLRVVAGTLMIHNALDKLGDIQGFADAYVSVIGLPFPVFFSYCAAYSELFGSLLLIVGLLTRPAAAALVFTMVVAIYHHIKVAGFSIPYLELSVLYAACFSFFLINGAGLFSIDAIVAGWLSALTSGQQRAYFRSLESSYKATEGADASRDRGLNKI